MLLLVDAAQFGESLIQFLDAGTLQNLRQAGTAAGLDLLNQTTCIQPLLYGLGQGIVDILNIGCNQRHFTAGNSDAFLLGIIDQCLFRVLQPLPDLHHLWSV